VGGLIFDDDLALSAGELVQGPALGNVVPEVQQGFDEGIPSFDEDGNFVIHGGLDEELTDADAECDTDLEPEVHDDEVMVTDGQ
jgi:hypothetical protein